MTETVQRAAGEGLRERKKRTTRRAIKRAALFLALERGVEKLTVEDISEAADVSQRTFFNYFACKEDALIGDGMEAAVEVRDLVLNRPADEPPLAVLHAVIAESEFLRTAHAQRDHVLARQRLIRDNPSLLPRQLAQYAGVERAFADAMAERLGLDAQRDLRPALLAAIAVGIVRVAMQRWTVDGTRPPDELIDEAFELMKRGP